MWACKRACHTGAFVGDIRVDDGMERAVGDGNLTIGARADGIFFDDFDGVHAFDGGGDKDEDNDDDDDDPDDDWSMTIVEGLQVSVRVSRACNVDTASDKQTYGTGTVKCKAVGDEAGRLARKKTVASVLASISTRNGSSCGACC